MSANPDTQLEEFVPLYRFTHLVANMAHGHMIADAFSQSMILTPSQIEFMKEYLQNAATLTLQALTEFTDDEKAGLLSLARALIKQEDEEA